MARVREIPKDRDEVKKDLLRSFQSGHINFLIGAGGSQPAVPLAGSAEKEINDLLLAGDQAAADRRLCDLISTVQEPSNRLIARARSTDDQTTLDYYEAFLKNIETIVTERRTNVLPKQATIFTTNYDVFPDTAARSCAGLRLATGFGTVPSADDVSEYSSGSFSLATFDTGNLYDYRVELPSLNLVKLHGCLSWKKDGDRIIRRSAQHLVPSHFDPAVVKDFLAHYVVILPQQSKHQHSVIERTYYELLRMYANALDRPNVVLVVFGFSFQDEHILHVTMRALKNPMLRLVIFAYDATAKAFYEAAFAANNNVIIVCSTPPDPIDFDVFNDLLRESVPSRSPAPATPATP